MVRAAAASARLMLAALMLAPLAAGLAQAKTAPTGAVALTFDDLPGLSIIPNEHYVESYNARLLARLKHHHVPASGFVNEGKFDEMNRAHQIAILRRWLDAGMDAGNHTFSHASPNELGADGYIADISKGEPITKAMLAQHGKTMRWFRHPYLETGTPAAVKDKIDGWLAAHGYRIAPVTLDADDWEFAEPYDDAVAHDDRARARQIQDEYLDHTKQMIAWYKRASEAVFGRPIPLVMLMHDTRLNADSIEAVLKLLHDADLRPVSLDTAMADPAYLTPDATSGKEGIDWVERWSDTLHKALPWDSYHDVPKDIAEDYDRVDPSGR